MTFTSKLHNRKRLRSGCKSFCSNLRIWISASLMIAGGALFTGCSKDKTQPNIEIIQDMMDQPSVKAQESDEYSAKGSGLRTPPDNTQPLGLKPYRNKTDLDAAAKNQNPFKGQMTDDLLKVGMKYYETNCKVCHGDKGNGMGHLSTSKKYPLPIPSLLSPKVRNWPDGMIYHVLTAGQGTMGPYASHIPADSRWKVVNYIRQLQLDENSRGEK